jgi:peptidoglycan/LPS O-acetylase OafA/YrhL
MVLTGILSYGLYIWHYPIAVALRDSVPWYWTLPMTLTLSFVGAGLCYLLVDRRRRLLRDASKRQPANAGHQEASESLDGLRGGVAARPR